LCRPVSPSVTASSIVWRTLAQAVVAALAADLRQAAGNQLVRIDRPHQVVRHAEVERTHDDVVVALLGDEQDRQEARAFQRAQLRAEAERVVVLEIGVDDDQLEIALGRLEERGLRIGHAGDVGDRLQRAGDALLRGAAPVDEEDVARLVAEIGVQPLLQRNGAGGGRAHAQLVRQRLQPHEALDARHELEVVDRLGEEVVRAGLQAPHAVGGLVERRHHDDGDMGGARIGLQPLADLETVDAGHHDVEQDEIDLRALADGQRIVAVLGRQHVEIFGEQPRFEQLHIGRNVVDDEDACRHADASRLTRPRDRS